MLQARRLGKELLVGVHSDEEILHNKGPTVMSLKERVAAVEACRWSTKSIPNAPYVTSLPWISHYGCFYVVHGDDITSDSNGEDCYRFVKSAGRFLTVRRTPGISTTDLVGRMLLCTKGHFIRSLDCVLDGEEGSGDAEERKRIGSEMRLRIEEYATDQTGRNPGCPVYSWSSLDVQSSDTDLNAKGTCQLMVAGQRPAPGQRIVYVDGGFDLFSSGHIEFLRQVTIKEEEIGRKRGWSGENGTGRSPAYIIAGVHDDNVINCWKGVNYPIMNIYERGLCVLQCCYIDSVVFSAPFKPSGSFLTSLPFGQPHVVYHGPTSYIPLNYDPYLDAKRLGIYQQISGHDFQDINAGEIVQRILKSKALYEARQMAKGEKSVLEQATSAHAGAIATTSDHVSEP
ncbi:uncharacterized protein KY384_006934 [Bacidia gigantensis]|uniref:uncharacterized protein n=1 Tax=Bacidia gigantensis TaxID=2732470 RepID=UPI001D039E84|nr:uncharacterized protein KY384_006934 [Bacidia gigantensis]KAG8528018.1 hypothetical protein KY384_006934 [Bacidia gigantensis]